MGQAHMSGMHRPCYRMCAALLHAPCSMPIVTAQSCNVWLAISGGGAWRHRGKHNVALAHNLHSKRCLKHGAAMQHLLMMLHSMHWHCLHAR